ncbi:pre-peptidase [Dulcicalothrix desertica PCC 7102]|nr:pre-peptidase [Dulcicalothrix desertica PCC 7102]
MANNKNKYYPKNNQEKIKLILASCISSSVLLLSNGLSLAASAKSLTVNSGSPNSRSINYLNTNSSNQTNSNSKQFLLAKPPDERQPEAVEQGIEKIPTSEIPQQREPKQPIKSPLPPTPSPVTPTPDPTPTQPNVTPTTTPTQTAPTPQPDVTPTKPPTQTAPQPQPVQRRQTPQPNVTPTTPLQTAPQPQPVQRRQTPQPNVTPTTPLQTAPQPQPVQRRQTPQPNVTPTTPLQTAPQPQRQPQPVQRRQTPQPNVAPMTPLQTAPQPQRQPQPVQRRQTPQPNVTPTTPLQTAPQPQRQSTPVRQRIESIPSENIESNQIPQRQRNQQQRTKSPVSSSGNYKNINFVDLEIGVLKRGDFQSQGRYFHFYQFEGTENQLIEVRLTGSIDKRRSNNLSLDPFMFLLDSNNQVILTRGSNELNNGQASGRVKSAFAFVRLPATGKYTIAVTSRNPRDSGRYSLALRNDRASYALDKSGVLTTRGSTIRRNGSPYSVSKFQGRRDQLVSIRADSVFEDFSPYVVLLNSRGEVVARDNDKDGRYSALIDRVRLPQDDIYYVVVISAIARERGTYRLTVF